MKTDMVSLVSRFYAFITDDKQWMPVHMKSWDDLVPTEEGIYYPRRQDLLFPSMILGVVLLGVRYLYERYLVVPLALSVGVKQKTHVYVEQNPILEEVYKISRVPNNATIQELCKKTSLSERQVQRWFRRRKKVDSPGDLKKFCECSWQFIFYICSFWYGAWVLWDKSWLWDIKECWNNHPFHHIPDPIFYYYFVEAAFYWNMVYAILYDHKRKDFKEMVVHHVTTLTLINASWQINYTRVGTLVLLAHDASDYWMLAAKMADYSKRDNLKSGLFVCFLVVWIISRLVYYPYVVYSCIFDNLESSDRILYYIIMGSLLALQLLHVIWSFMIGKIVVEAFTKGEVKDVRSDSEEDEKVANGMTNSVGVKEKVLNGTVEASQNKLTINTSNRLKHRA